MSSKKDQELRNAGLKVTGPRLQVLQIFEQSKDRHLSADAVFQELSQQSQDVSLATVYRVLTQFEQAGLIRRHHFEGDHAVFELDAGEHHDHLVCIHCGHVNEFMDELIEARQDKIAQDAGFIVTAHTHTIYGVCRKCQ